MKCEWCGAEKSWGANCSKCGAPSTKKKDNSSSYKSEETENEYVEGFEPEEWNLYHGIKKRSPEAEEILRNQNRRNGCLDSRMAYVFMLLFLGAFVYFVIF